MLPKKFGVLYRDGKILFYKALKTNPHTEISDKPSWAVDVREVLAIFFVGAGAIALILTGQADKGTSLLSGLLGYVIGRTIKVEFVRVPSKEKRE